MPRVIGLIDLVIVIVAMWIGFHLCLWVYRQYKKEEKKK